MNELRAVCVNCEGEDGMMDGGEGRKKRKRRREKPFAFLFYCDCARKLFCLQIESRQNHLWGVSVCECETEERESATEKGRKRVNDWWR